MKDYPEALQDCLERLRRGRDLADVLAAYPQYADRLRQALAAATSAYSVSNSLPPPDVAGRQRLLSALATERTADLRPAAPAGFWQRLGPVRSLGGAAVALVAVLAIGLGLLGGLPGLGTDAEAATLEVVVVDSGDGLLQVQTDTGLQSVQLTEKAALSGPDLKQVKPGEVLVIRGKQLSAESFSAAEVKLQAADALPAWCEKHPAACAQLAQNLRNRIEACQAYPRACQAVIRDRLQEVSSQLGMLVNLRQLAQRCRGGDRSACQELAVQCSRNGELCKPFAGLLKSRPLGPAD
jgi:hypothetical protein